MSWMLNLLTTDSWARLSSVLLHSLWQGTLIAGLLYVLLRLLPARRANLRYVLSLVGLLAVVLGAAATWSVLGHISSAESGIAGARSWWRANWSSIIVIVWMVGAAVMFVRIVRSLQVASNVRKGSSKLYDPSFHALIDELKSDLGISRKVGLAVCEVITSPAVLGAVCPVILLPPAMLCGMPTEQIRSILTHELAHIRRYDYLVNLFQMVIESLGFFNPAVWWISRQVRVEREACCDALCVSTTGQPAMVAQTLASYAMRSKHPAAPETVVSFSDEGGSALVDRVRRIVKPSHRPPTRLPLPSLLLGLVLSLLILASLAQATAWTVDRIIIVVAGSGGESGEGRDSSSDAVVDEISFDSPAIEEHIDETPGTDKPKPDKNSVRVQGVVVTGDGRPLPSQAMIAFLVRSQESRTIVHKLAPDGRFDQYVPAGITWLSVKAKGYTPALHGPINTAAGQQFLDNNVVLSKGFTARVYVQDSYGRPVRGAVIRQWGWKHQMPDQNVCIGMNDRLESDEQGLLTIPNASDNALLLLETRVEGYQFDFREFQLAKGEVETWTLNRARPTMGTVVSAATGEPVAGAKIRLFRRHGFRPEVGLDPRIERINCRAHQHHGDGTATRAEWAVGALAITDKQGRFSINTLRDDSHYVLGVISKKHVPLFVSDVRAGQKDVTFRLPKPIIVRGKIIGDLKKLVFHSHNGKEGYHFTYCNPFSRGGSSYQQSFCGDVRIEGDHGAFEIRLVLPGQMTLHFPGQDIKLNVTKSIDDLVVDLNKPKEISKMSKE